MKDLHSQEEFKWRILWEAWQCVTAKHMHGYSRLRANEEMSKSSSGSISRCSLLRQTDKVKWYLEAIHRPSAFVYITGLWLLQL